MKTLVINSGELCNFSEWPICALKGVADVVTDVAHLLFSSGPAHITWFVVSVVIDAIKGMSRCRTLTHVQNERREIVFPAFAHRDSTSAVVMEANGGWNETPFLGLQPRDVCWRAVPVASSANRRAMSSAMVAACVTLQTAATPSQVSQQRILVDDFQRAAVAAAFPIDAPASSVLNTTQSNQSSRTKSGYVFPSICSGHGQII